MVMMCLDSNNYHPPLSLKIFEYTFFNFLQLK